MKEEGLEKGGGGSLEDGTLKPETRLPTAGYVAARARISWTSRPFHTTKSLPPVAAPRYTWGLITEGILRCDTLNKVKG